MDEEGNQAEDRITELARKRFGISYLFPFQRLVIANVLEAAEAGQEGPPPRQIVLLPTGFGKSLCFQLPALLLPGPSLVVYPLLALMADQQRRLAQLGIPCAVFRGGQEPAERAAQEAAVASGAAKLVLTNPECLALPRLRDFLRGHRPSHVAIDEAHCVSEWGETFRPAYLELGRILGELGPACVSAFTATAGPAVCEAIASRLFAGQGYRIVEGDPDRPNISYSVVRTLCRERTLTRFARELPRPLLVFEASREGVQILAGLLRRRLKSRDVRFYHAGLGREEKGEIEDWFFASREGILVSTCAYGMGVDKKDIRAVVHFSPPSTVEAYLQESGRVGRDGQRSQAVLIATPWDGGRGGDGLEPSRLSRRRAFLGYATMPGCRRENLLDLLGSSRSERAPCSGCDRCEDRETTALEGEREIRDFLVWNPRRFRADRAVALLAGRWRGEPPLCAGWGSMAGWDEEDAAHAMAAALRLGLAREMPAWPWKAALAPARRSLLT